jgi:hypothetical protein
MFIPTLFLPAVYTTKRLSVFFCEIHLWRDGMGSLLVMKAYGSVIIDQTIVIGIDILDYPLKNTQADLILDMKSDIGTWSNNMLYQKKRRKKTAEVLRLPCLSSCNTRKGSCSTFDVEFC